MPGLESPGPSGSSQKRSEPSVVSTADLAKYLNLSQWTVSRAINGHHDISEETRKRVLTAMDELGFRPNPFARGLRGRGISMIGICFSRLNIPILDQKVFELQEYLRNRGFRSLLEASLNDPENEQRVLEDFRRIRVDGVVIFFSMLSSSKIRQATRSMALVSVDPWWPQEVPMVMLDRHTAMRQIIDHLLDLGHRSFALLGISPDNIWRWPPLAEGVMARGLNPDEVFSWYKYPSPFESPIKGGAEMAARALSLKPRPTAFICQDDLIALGAIQTVKDAGLSVPKDISVTGFNNQDVAQTLRPTLTTVDQHPSSTIARVGELLSMQLALPARDRGKAVEVKIKGSFIARESTGPAPKNG